MKRLAILGLGLMGGSLGLAVKRRRLPWHVVGFARRAEVTGRALEVGAIDEVAGTPADAVFGADIAVLCVPVLRLAELAGACAPGLKSGCIVTDVGSTKTQVVKGMESAVSGRGVYVVGSHPIAGSDETGLEAANAGLYDSAMVVVTKSGGTNPHALQATVDFWRQVGGRVEVMSPEAHDAMLARTSHLPHLVAAALANAVLGGEDRSRSAFCGSGFRDTTRIAAGSEELWHDIVRSNADAIMLCLNEFSVEIERFSKAIREERFDVIKALLAEARERRSVLSSAEAAEGAS